MRSTRTSTSEHLVNMNHKSQRHAEENVPASSVPAVVTTDAQRPAQSPKTRWTRIARRAYELAQQRGFAPGAELSDWLQAEQEIDAAETQQRTAPAHPDRQRTSDPTGR